MMNKNRMIAVTWVLLLTLSTILSSCRKYEDGPTISFLTKQSRVANDWRAAAVFRNDIDETTDFPVYAMTFSKAGRLTWTIQKEGQVDPVVVTANWELASVKEQIKITFDTKDPLSGETRLLYMDILRLTESELWVSFLSEGDYYDLRLE
ncbi:MAG: hypothetical protein SF052_11720 [Bacteroidia bacterium]|nr:hypothetical protein [Bacteroidia bacterium]